MRQCACLVVNPITANNFASSFNYKPVGRESDSLICPYKRLVDLFKLVGTGLSLVCCLAISGFNWRFSFAPGFHRCCFTPLGSTGVRMHCFCRVIISDSS